MQLRELRDYCQRRGWEVAGEYVDAGGTGSKEQRPELDRLLTECCERRVDAVVVYRYARFARSLRQLVNALEEFRALGIAFVSLHEGVDTSTPNGRLVFGIFASIAEFERELTRDRVRSGLAAACVATAVSPLGCAKIWGIDDGLPYDDASVANDGTVCAVAF